MKKENKTQKSISLFKVLKLILIIGAIIYCTQTFISQEITKNKTKVDIAAAEQRIALLEIERDNLAVALKNIGTPEFMEKMAREKLGMVKSNEVIYVDANSR